MQDRARDVVRQVGDHVVRRLDEVDEVLVERVALDEPQADSTPSNRSRRNAARPRSSSTAVTAAPAASRPPVRRPRPGPDLEDPAAGRAGPPRPGSRRGRPDRPGSSATGVWRARRPAARSVARTASGSTRGARSRSSGGDPDGQRQRWPGVEVEPGPLAGGEPPGAGRADHRPVVGAQRRSRHDQAAGRAPPPRPASRARRTPLAATPPPITIERAPRRHGGPDRLGHEDVDDRVLEAPGELGDDVVGERLVGVGREAGVGAGLGDDPAGRGLEAGEAQVVASRPARPAGRPGRALVAASAARPIAGPPG